MSFAAPGLAPLWPVPAGAEAKKLSWGHASAGTGAKKSSRGLDLAGAEAKISSWARPRAPEDTDFVRIYCNALFHWHMQKTSSMLFSKHRIMLVEILNVLFLAESDTNCKMISFFVLPYYRN